MRNLTKKPNKEGMNKATDCLFHSKEGHTKTQNVALKAPSTVRRPHKHLHILKIVLLIIVLARLQLHLHKDY